MNQCIVRVSPLGHIPNLEHEIEDLLIKRKGKQLLVVFIPYSGEVTAQMRGYYFSGVIDEAIKQCETFRGWSKEDLHDWLKTECNKRELVNQKTGEVTFVVGSTAKMGKWDYAQFIDRCIQRLAEEGHVVRTPDEYYKELEQKQLGEIPAEEIENHDNL